jgi:hypothetical protein
MSSNRNQSRWTFMDPAYAASPQIFHWLANTVGVVGLAGPYLTVLVPCFAAVWGANQLQLLFGPAACGTISAQRFFPSRCCSRCITRGASGRRSCEGSSTTRVKSPSRHGGVDRGHSAQLQLQLQPSQEQS